LLLTVLGSARSAAALEHPDLRPALLVVDLVHEPVDDEDAAAAFAEDALALDGAGDLAGIEAHSGVFHYDEDSLAGVAFDADLDELVGVALAASMILSTTGAMAAVSPRISASNLCERADGLNSKVGRLCPLVVMGVLLQYNVALQRMKAKAARFIPQLPFAESRVQPFSRP
jgi:hypothetical protein